MVACGGSLYRAAVEVCAGRVEEVNQPLWASVAGIPKSDFRLYPSTPAEGVAGLDRVLGLG